MACCSRSARRRGPRYIQGLPVEKRARHLAHFPGMPDMLVARLLVSYHLAHQRPMMAAFLDAIGLAHDNGLITEDPAEPISRREDYAAGAKALAAAYPPDAVKLYFSTLLAQDPDTWKGPRGAYPARMRQRGRAGSGPIARVYVCARMRV